LVNGVATLTVTNLGVGSHQITATYLGDSVVCGIAVCPSHDRDHSDTTSTPQGSRPLRLSSTRSRMGTSTPSHQGNVAESAAITVTIYSVATGKKVRTLALGTKVGAYSARLERDERQWCIQPAGKYKIVQFVRDASAIDDVDIVRNAVVQADYWTRPRRHDPESRSTAATLRATRSNSPRGS